MRARRRYNNYDHTSIKKGRYYIVDLRVLMNPVVLREEFKSRNEAKDWLDKRRTTIKPIQFQIERGKAIKDYNLPWITYYTNAGPKTKKRIKALYSLAGYYHGKPTRDIRTARN